MKLYQKMTQKHMRENHFYKMHRFVFFNRFIFTIDVYPEQTDFGFMLAMSSFSLKFWSIK